MKKTTRILAVAMVFVLIFGVFSITANAASGYGVMVPTDSKYKKQLSTVTLYGKKDYLNLAIDCNSDNTYFIIGICKDKNYEKVVWEDAVYCGKGSYTYTPAVSLTDMKSGTYYGLAFAAKINSRGQMTVDETSMVQFKVKVNRTTSFSKQIVILKSYKNTVDGPQISWNKLSGASKYTVYRRAYDSSKWTSVGTTSKTSFVDKSMKSKSGEYVYTVKGVSKGGTSSRYQFMGIQAGVVGAPKVSSVSVSGNDHTIKWNKISGVKTYIVYRKAEGGSYKKVGTVKNGATSYVDKSTKTSGKKYYYTVKAQRTLFGETITSSYYSAGKSIYFVTAPKITARDAKADNAICIEWKSVKGAKYTIYRKESGGSWKSIEKNYTSTTYYDNTEKTDGVKYTYAVRATVNGKQSHYIACTYKMFSAMPELVGVNASQTGAELTWTPVESAVKYRVLSKPGDGSAAKRWTEVAVVDKDTTTYTDENLYGARVYTVQPVNSDAKGSFNGKGIQYINIPDIEGAIADPTGERLIKFVWNTDLAEAVDGFNVYRKTAASDEWALVKELTKDTEYIDTDVEYDVAYSYAVVAVMNGFEAEINEELAKAAIVTDEPLVETNPLAAFKNACKDIAENGSAGYTKYAWQQVTKELEANSSVPSFMLDTFKDVINNILTTEADSVDSILEKGSDEAKAGMPVVECTEDAISSVTSEKVGENYIVTIVMKEQLNPTKTDVDGINAVSDTYIAFEHFDACATEAGAGADELKYNSYTITAEMTADGKLVSVTHYGEADYKMNASMVTGDTKFTGSFAVNTTYTDFIY